MVEGMVVVQEAEMEVVTVAALGAAEGVATEEAKAGEMMAAAARVVVRVEVTAVVARVAVVRAAVKVVAMAVG